MSFTDEVGQAESLEPQFPPWYEASAAEQEELVDGGVGKETLENIIQIAFDKLAAHFGGYQTRTDQIAMAKSLLVNMIQESSSVIEAGTGIGKSFAYIIAACAYSYLASERVLVTTETKNLQMQLYEKDMPVIRQLLDKDLAYELCLGSSNYLCRLRYDEALDQGKFQHLIDDDELSEFKEWATRVFDGKGQGSIFECETEITSSFWSIVSRDSDGCPAQKCQFFSNCNYYATKNLWNQARLLIGNHHLLLFHLLNEKRTLPGYGAVILDEAHGFMKTGFSIFTLSFSQEAMNEQKKTFDRALNKISSLPLEATQEFNELWAKLQSDWQAFFSTWEVELDLNFSEEETKVISKPIYVAGDSILTNIEAIKNHIANLLEDEASDSTLINTLKVVDKTFGRMQRFMNQLAAMNLDRYVYWGRKENGLLYLYSCNLNLGEELDGLLTETQVYTSATLGYWPFSNAPRSKQDMLGRGYFQNFLAESVPGGEETGLANLAQEVYFSPFQYSESAILYVPKDLPMPAFGAAADEQEAYHEALLEEIIELINLSGGGALVLFTSNYLMQVIGDELEELTDYKVYSQLRYGATTALEKFKQDRNSVLLGTSSFWQGVDVVGDGLRMLIITKLMFTPPEDPIFKARSTQFEKKGKRPFFELALPYASTMLRQAFGRLIRSESDKGVVAILDERLLKKNYGKTLLGNLPPVRVAQGKEQLEAYLQKYKIYSS